MIFGEYANQMQIFNTLYESSNKINGLHFTAYEASYYMSPNKSNYSYLGDADHKWKEVWATNGTIQTSDRRKKKRYFIYWSKQRIRHTNVRESVKKIHNGIDALHLSFN